MLTASTVLLMAATVSDLFLARDTGGSLHESAENRDEAYLSTALTQMEAFRKVQRMYVGLTGGVASGKSTVAAMLRELGAIVVDADVLAREVVEPGTPGLAAVVAEFGPDVLTADGRLDRSRVGAIVFADRDRRGALEAIIHPRVRARAAEIEAAAPPGVVVVHDIPLLVETGQAGEFDAVVVVDVPEDLQVQRATRDRGWSEDEARSRISAQASRAARVAAATHVIDNSGALEDLRDRVAEVFGELVRLKSTG
jgi:dephospho-CoA kinase